MEKTETKFVFILCLCFFGLGYLINDYIENNQIQNTQENTQAIFIRNDIQHWINPNKWLLTLNFNESTYKISGSNGISMEPTINEYDLTICDNSIKTYKTGMIIQYKKENELIQHRIKATYDNYLITQGDNNLYEDTPINYSQINCVVIATIY